MSSWNLLLTSCGSRHCTCANKVGLRRRGENISVDFSLFVLLYTVIRTSCTNLNWMIFFSKLKTKIFHWLYKNFYHPQNHPTFHSEERLVNLVRGKGSFVGLSMLLVSVLSMCRSHSLRYSGGALHDADKPASFDHNFEVISAKPIYSCNIIVFQCCAFIKIIF